MANGKVLSRLVLATLALLSSAVVWAQAVQSQEKPAQPPPAVAAENPPQKLVQPIPRPGEAKPPAQPGQPGQPVAEPAKPAGPPPEMVLKETEFDAGNVNKGDIVKHDFLVENKGKGPLLITHVQPGCGCTVTEFDKEIAPGKSGKITASVNTAGFSGPISKPISVTTNDVKLATFQLTMKATVKAILNVEPSEYQQFGLLFKGQPAEKVFKIKSEDGSPFNVTQIAVDDAALKYEVTMAADKKSADFKVSIPSDHAVGPISGRFTLTTTHPKAPTLTISVFGTIREPLTVYPTELVYSGLGKDFVNENPENVTLNKTVTVSFEQAADLEIKSVVSSLPFIEATSTAVTPNQRYSIAVKIKPPVKEGDFNGIITIVTNKKTITVPVHGKIF
jgi:hypothetical protein